MLCALIPLTLPITQASNPQTLVLVLLLLHVDSSVTLLPFPSVQNLIHHPDKFPGSILPLCHPSTWNPSLAVKPMITFQIPGSAFQPLSFWPISCYFPKHLVATCFPTIAPLTPFRYPHTLCFAQCLCFFWLPVLGPFQSTMLKSNALSCMTRSKFLFLQEVFPESSSPPWAEFLSSLPSPIIRQLVIYCSSSQNFWTQAPLHFWKLLRTQRAFVYVAYIYQYMPCCKLKLRGRVTQFI